MVCDTHLHRRPGRPEARQLIEALDARQVSGLATLIEYGPSGDQWLPTERQAHARLDQRASANELRVRLPCRQVRRERPNRAERLVVVITPRDEVETTKKVDGARRVREDAR